MSPFLMLTSSPNAAPWHEIVMTRPHLRHLPHETANGAAWQLPHDFSLRPFQAGDDQIWTQIHRLADPFNIFDEDTFVGQFGKDERVLQQRMRFLVAPDGETIGTATAWFDDAEVGRVHWVAIVPEFQNRGLGRGLLGEILRLLREMGHTRAILSTDSRRPNAVALYRSAGFIEEISS